MNFFEHIEELRWHIVRSVAFLLVVTILIFIFSKFIFEDVIFGPLDVNFWSYKVLCKIAKDFCVTEIPVKLINTEIAGQFFLHIKTAFMLGVMASVPYFLWEVWLFILPALHKSERNYAQVLLGFGFLLFLLGSAFGYFIIFPITLIFLTGYTVSNDIVNMPNISNYFENLSDTVLWTGIMFELPIIAYFLSKMGVLTTDFMHTYRKHLYVAILVAAAAITPSPDMFSQIMVAIPLFILFEISVLVVARAQRGENEKEDVSL